MANQIKEPVLIELERVDLDDPTPHQFRCLFCETLSERFLLKDITHNPIKSSCGLVLHPEYITKENLLRLKQVRMIIQAKCNRTSAVFKMNKNQVKEHVDILLEETDSL